MSPKTLTTAAATIALFSQAACMTSAALAQCTVSGTKYLSADATADEICRSFTKRLNETLAAGREKARADDMIVAIELHKHGSIEAHIADKDGAIAYPKISVAVMDRPLAQTDLHRLADAVAQLLIDR